MNNLCVALFPCMNLRTEIELLKQQLSEGNATITELQQQLLNANRRIAELEKKNEELERRLLAYENAVFICIKNLLIPHFTHPAAASRATPVLRGSSGQGVRGDPSQQEYIEPLYIKFTDQ